MATPGTSTPVLVMDQGQIAEEGAAADVMENPSNPRTRAFPARYRRDAMSEKALPA